MNKINYIKLLMLVCFVMSFGMIITSCDDDDEKVPNAGMPVLLSFGPSGVQHGDDIRFIGRNLNLVDAIELPGVTVPKSAFKSQTSELIVLTVPQETMEGVVTLKTAKGDVTSKTILSFEVPITVTSVTDVAKPGTNITIEGTKLTWAKGVMFGSDTVKTFVSQSPTELVLQVPMTAKTGKLVILGGGTEPAFVETEEELTVILPTATAVAPTTVYNGQNLTITGTDLDLVKEVWFKGSGDTKATTFVSKSATELVVKVPANAVKGTITLVPYSGVEVPTTHEVTMVLPAVTALSPASVKHDEILTITGTDLDLVKEVQFKGVGAANVTKFETQSANEITLKVPTNASKGKLTLVAKSGAMVETTQEVVITLPVITSITPSPVDPGQNITISGENLDLVKRIQFPDSTVATTFVSQSPSQIVVKIPMDAKAGKLFLTTTKDYRVATDAKVNIILPTLTSATPNELVAGEIITLNGSNLHVVQKVVFANGTEVTNFMSQSPTQIVFPVPFAAAGKGNLKLIKDTGFEVQTDKSVVVTTGGPNISSFIYDDAVKTGWVAYNGYGLAAPVDWANTEHVNRGSKAIKISFKETWGAAQLHPNNATILNGYTHIVLYVRGGSVDSQLTLWAQKANNSESQRVAFNVKAGEYSLIEIPISALGDVSGGINDLRINNGSTAPYTIWVDDIGLR